MTPSAYGPGLRLVQGAREETSGWTWCCSQCGAAPSEDVPSLARVCRSCGMGVLLETHSSPAPGRDDAFLVVDSHLRVQALSPVAEVLLDVFEEEVINHPVIHFLGAPEAETRGPDDLITLLSAVSTDSDEVHSLSVRPVGAFGVRVVARISPCVPPRAALVVLGARAPRRDLHLV